MKFELCTDSLEGAKLSKKYKLTSIELCSALSVGGLTPSFGLIKQCVEATSSEVHVMIRHKEGAFTAEKNDIMIMALDIHAAKRAGAHGVVFGILDVRDTVADENLNLVRIAKSLGLKTTFHRAFDFVPDVNEAMTKVIDHGFDRLLTSGQALFAEEGLDVLGKMQVDYGDKIQIIAGSGVNGSNALKFKDIGIDYIHFTARKPDGRAISLGMGQYMSSDSQKIDAILGLTL